MSIIQFKIITNQFYEALHFDGLSLSVKEVKKLVIEKKFGSSTVVNRKLSDFDLEISNLDTNQGERFSLFSENYLRINFNFKCTRTKTTSFRKIVESK